MAGRSLMFRIVYNLLYVLVHLVLITFLLVTPGDLINQALGRDQFASVIVTILACVASVIIIFFVHVTRLVVSRSVLASIPKAYIPIEKGDVREDVRAMIDDGLRESAAVAFRATPRIETVKAPRTHGEVENNKRKVHLDSAVKFPLQPNMSTDQDRGTAATRAQNEDAVVTFGPNPAPWGKIEHAGWSSPLSPDLPNVQYSTVIRELAHLLEAKALTFAPPGSDDDEDPGHLDAEAASLLQRHKAMGVREYLVYLFEIGVLAGMPAGVIKDFIEKYEYARFSTRALSEAQFRDLMHLLAQVLRGMGPPDVDMLYGHDSSDDDSHSNGDVDDNAPMATNPSTPGRNTPRKVGAGSSADQPRRFSYSSSSAASSREQLLHPRVKGWWPAEPTPSANTRQRGTAPTSSRTPRNPRNRHTAAMGAGNDGREPSRSSSASTFAPSFASLQSYSQSDGGSVIRLATPEDDTEMPYVFIGDGASGP